MNIHVITSILIPILLGLVTSFSRYKALVHIQTSKLVIFAFLESLNVKSHLYNFKRKIKLWNVNILVITSILIPILLGLFMSFTRYKALVHIRT